MKKLIAWIFFILSPIALAGGSPAAVLNLCDQITKDGQSKCTLGATDTSSVIIIDRIKPPTTESSRAILILRDGFFQVGGAVFEIHDAKKPNSDFISCGLMPRTRKGYGCELNPASNSMRKLIKTKGK